MTNRKPGDIPLNVARYRTNRDVTPEERTDALETITNEAGQSMMDARDLFVETSIQQAMRRGDFDNLPGAGKPIPGLSDPYDPDWWIRRKIEREQITGLGPPALTLRSEDAGLDTRLDALGSEREVRDVLTDFNRRVIDARRQLHGGPPVVTALRDIDIEIEHRQTRLKALRIERDAARERDAQALAAMTWRQRRRAKRKR